jgi:23S rRNA pseudouridine1911/1915/1917 synthase
MDNKPAYEIIYENSDFLVINKPAGLLVHGADHIKETSLADQLLAAYPALARVGEDSRRPGLMHRLDKSASGLMVIAKKQNVFDHLKGQFQARRVEKIYTALVHGKISKDEGEINFPICRSVKGSRMAALPATDKGEQQTAGRQAITEFTVAKRFVNYTFLKVKIKTGRTHQIRVHLSAYGYPVVGDDLYGTRKTKTKNQKLGLGRIFLVADELSFTDLAGQKHSFSIPLPPELSHFLEKLN